MSNQWYWSQCYSWTPLKLEPVLLRFRWHSAHCELLPKILTDLSKFGTLCDRLICNSTWWQGCLAYEFFRTPASFYHFFSRQPFAFSDSFGYSVNQHFSIRSQYALQDTKPSSKQELDSPHFQWKGVPLTSEVNINTASRKALCFVFHSCERGGWSASWFWPEFRERYRMCPNNC